MIRLPSRAVEDGGVDGWPVLFGVDRAAQGRGTFAQAEEAQAHDGRVPARVGGGRVDAWLDARADRGPAETGVSG